MIIAFRIFSRDIIASVATGLRVTVFVRILTATIFLIIGIIIDLFRNITMLIYKQVQLFDYYIELVIQLTEIHG